VDPVKSPSGGCPRDRRGGISERKQLVRRDDTVLSIREGRQPGMGAHFVPHTGAKCAHMGFSPPWGCPQRADIGGEHLFASLDS